MKTGRKILSVLLVLTMLLTSCMTSNMTVEAATKKPTKITLNYKTTSMSVGEKLTLKVKSVKPSKASKSVKWTSSNKKIATVNSKGKVTAKKAGTVTITAKAKGNSKAKAKCTIKVTDVPTPPAPAPNTPTPPAPEPDTPTPPAPTPDNPTPPAPMPDMPSGTYYTRAEWIAVLVDKMGYSFTEENLMKDETTGEVIYSYNDIYGNANAVKIEAAMQNAILPVEADSEGSQSFEPDGSVTREFAALTAVRALGLSASTAPNFSDNAQLKYPTEAQASIETGMFTLKSGAFCPNEAVTTEEYSRILSLMDEVLKSRKIDTEHVDEIVYTDNVVQDTSDMADYEVSVTNGKLYVTLPKNADTLALEEGQIVLLPANNEYEDGLPIKIAAISIEEENLVITGEIPQTEEVFEHVDMEGVGQVDINNIELADGVTLMEEEGEVANLGGKEIENLPISIEQKFKVTFDDKKGTAVLDLKINSIQYKLDFTKRKVNEVLVQIPNTITATFDGNSEWSGEKKIGTIPVKLPAGFTLDIILYVVAEANGSIHLKYSLDNTFGVHYIDGIGMQRITDISKTWEIESEVNAKSGANLSVEILWVKDLQNAIAELAGKEPDAKPLYTVETEAGVGVDAKSVVQNVSLTCTDASAWIYWDVSVGEECLLSDIVSDLKHEWNIFEKSNSPLKGKWHLENGRRVSSCTYSPTSILYSGNWRGMDWTIDDAGKLTISGEYTSDSSEREKPEWLEYRKNIQSAVVTARNVESTDCWFYYCDNIKEIDLSGFDTGNVKDMSNMFEGCSSLTNLDLSGFNTGNVTSMWRMFEGCSSLTNLDLSGFNTGNVYNMYAMFSGCSSLTNLDLSGFDTKNVTDMSKMFDGCNSLTNLDLSGFDTKNVTDMSDMFYCCESLTNLDLSGFETGNVMYMYSMFSGCSSLTNLDLSGFNTGNVYNMDYMFYGCSSLTNLDLSGFNTGNVTRMWSMFSGCNSLMTINVPLNVSTSCALPTGTWQDANGTTYTKLPLNVTESFVITKTADENL